MDLVEDLLHVALAAGGRNDFTRNFGQPIKTFLAHLGRKDRDGIAGEKFGVECTAAAVVSSGGPYRFMVGRIELSRYKAGNQASERSADLMAAGREPFAGQNDDAGFDSGQCGRNFDEIDITERAAAGLRLVAPGDTEKVQRIQVPEADILQLVLNLVGNQIRIAHLSESRNDNASLTRANNRTLEIVTVHGKIDHIFSPVLYSILRIKNTLSAELL